MASNSLDLVNYEPSPTYDSESQFDIKKAIIAVHFYAQLEQDIHPLQRLTYAHIAAIKRLLFCSILPPHQLAYMNANMVQAFAINLTRKTIDMSIAIEKLPTGFIRTEEEISNLIYLNCVAVDPGLSREQFEEDLDNMKFFDELCRNPGYEKTRHICRWWGGSMRRYRRWWKKGCGC